MPYKKKEDEKAFQAEYYQEHKKESNERKDRWRNKNPGKVLLANAKKRAQAKGFEFTIDETDIVIPEVCPVFGTPIATYHGSGRKGWNPDPNTPTLDRIDNTKGYVKGNVWVISWRANKLKSDSTLEDLEKLTSALRAKLGSLS